MRRVVALELRALTLVIMSGLALAGLGCHDVGAQRGSSNPSEIAASARLGTRAGLVALCFRVCASAQEAFGPPSSRVRSVERSALRMRVTYQRDRILAVGDPAQGVAHRSVELERRPGQSVANRIALQAVRSRREDGVLDTVRSDDHLLPSQRIEQSLLLARHLLMHRACIGVGELAPEQSGIAIERTGMRSDGPRRTLRLGRSARNGTEHRHEQAGTTGVDVLHESGGRSPGGVSMPPCVDDCRSESATGEIHRLLYESVHPSAVHDRRPADRAQPCTTSIIALAR